MQQQAHSQKLFSIDSSEPVTLQQIIADNSEEDVTPLEPGTIEKLEKLEVGEVFPGGLGADIRRVQ